MTPWKAKLSLDTLDERIVPDATPLAPPPVAGHCHEVVTYTDGHTCGAGVATYYCVSGPEDDVTSGGGRNDGDYTTASDTVSYDNDHTSATGTVSHDNDQTPADDVITHADGSDGSNPGDQAVTQVGNLNDLQDKTVPDLNLTTNVPVDPAAPGNPHASEITNPTSASGIVSYGGGNDDNPSGDDTTTNVNFTTTEPAPPVGAADDAKELAALKKDVTNGYRNIVRTREKIEGLDSFIACGKEHEIELRMRHTDLVGASIAAGGALQRLEALGQVNGPSYANAVQADADAVAAVFKNYADQKVLRNEIKELVRQRDVLIERINRFQNQFDADCLEVKRLEAKLQ